MMKTCCERSPRFLRPSLSANKEDLHDFRDKTGKRIRKIRYDENDNMREDTSEKERKVKQL